MIKKCNCGKEFIPCFDESTLCDDCLLIELQIRSGKIKTPPSGFELEYEDEEVFLRFYSAGTRNSKGYLETMAILPSGDHYPIGFVTHWRMPGDWKVRE